MASGSTGGGAGWQGEPPCPSPLPQLTVSFRAPSLLSSLCPCPPPPESSSLEIRLGRHSSVYTLRAGPWADIFIFGPHNTPEGATAIPADRSSRVREGRVGQSSRWEVGEHTDTQCLLPSDTEGKVSLGPFSSEALRLLPMQNRDVTQ